MPRPRPERSRLPDPSPVTTNTEADRHMEQERGRERGAQRQRRADGPTDVHTCRWTNKQAEGRTRRTVQTHTHNYTYTCLATPNWPSSNSSVARLRLQPLPEVDEEKVVEHVALLAVTVGIPKLSLQKPPWCHKAKVACSWRLDRVAAVLVAGAELFWMMLFWSTEDDNLVDRGELVASRPRPCLSDVATLSRNPCF